VTRGPLLPLFFVSAGAVGFEIALTRYFAIASWSEYGYWVISVTMAGLAVSGVVLSLWKETFTRHAVTLMRFLPLALILAATAGFHEMVRVPFNPLEFQSPDGWQAQLLNVGKYYAALVPFFFLTGLYIGLYFLSNQNAIPKVYATDLAGAGAGALFVLALMSWLHPFQLVPGLLPVLAVGAWLHLRGARNRALLTTVLLVCFAACELLLLRFNRADFNEYKAIYAPLHVEGNRVVREVRSSRGYYLVLDNFTERLDVDFSNNAGLLDAAAPPSTFGVYSDGNRLTSLPKPEAHDETYARALLDNFPYELRPRGEVLLIGTRGGFRVHEALLLGSKSVTAIEPDPVLLRLIEQAPAGPVTKSLSDRRVTLLRASPAMLASQDKRRFDLIDVSPDFSSQSETNKFAFTAEAVRGYLGILRERGVVSIPMSIREFTVYALKLLETVREGLSIAGVQAPEKHILLYRSGWSARILVSPAPFSPADIARLQEFASARSFDTSYFPGIDPAKVEVWNELPEVSFQTETVVAASADALMDESRKLLSREHDAFLREHFFRIEPATQDRPSPNSVLRFSKLRTLLRTLSVIPREELGLLINLAVLIQAVLIAVLIVPLPLFRWRRTIPRSGPMFRAVLYFAGLGLGFLCLEIYLIEKAAFVLNDRTEAIAIILAAMLIFSGLGSFLCGRFYANHPRRGAMLACLAILIWVAAARFGLDPLLGSVLNAPDPLKWLVLLAVTAPLSIALGFPFPLALSTFRNERSHFLPWAWSVNGSFSVIATPLANLLAVTSGFRSVLLLSGALYLLVMITYPVMTETSQETGHADEDLTYPVPDLSEPAA